MKPLRSQFHERRGSNRIRRALQTILTISALLAACGDSAKPTPNATPVPATHAVPPTAAVQTPATTASAAQTSIATGSPEALAAAQAVTVTGMGTLSVTLPATLAVTTTTTPCLTPAGWIEYEVQTGETLTQLAAEAGSTVAQLMRGNCLPGDMIIAGDILLLPATPARTPTPCTVPAQWISHRIRAGDTLSALAAQTGSSVAEIQHGNCMDGDILITDQLLYLPRSLPQAVSPALLPPAPAAPPASDAAQPPVSGAPAAPAPAQPHSPFASRTGLPGDPVSFPDPETELDDQCEAEGGSGFRIVSGGGVDVLEIGQTHYFYACDVTGNQIAATVTYSGTNSRDLLVYARPPIPEIAAINPYPVAVWQALPDTPTGEYQIVMQDAQGNKTAPLSFTLVLPHLPWIAVVPPAGAPGAPFEFYYINFPHGPLVSSLRGSATVDECIGTIPEKLKDLQVTIDQTTGTFEWGYLVVPSTGAKRACYIVAALGAKEVIIMLN